MYARACGNGALRLQRAKALSIPLLANGQSSYRTANSMLIRPFVPPRRTRISWVVGGNLNDGIANDWFTDGSGPLETTPA